MDLTIQLNDACNKLRIIINNERNAEYYELLWKEKAKESTQLKTIKKEVSYVNKKTQR